MKPVLSDPARLFGGSVHGRGNRDCLLFGGRSPSIRGVLHA
ncbi:hypothetical protein WQQ_08760 [Hydrocarboniphaga effusa AP103]|uniref:Uncharacterized protein n=1 Tax=Hydrocarboniphaga effusa AP103 TaxID=1172194 RepID=I7ZFP9_9GAMM|nr:hypothetical protein WQQ_08760 [Hydrocarboniphaga effusa AP103]